MYSLKSDVNKTKSMCNGTFILKIETAAVSSFRESRRDARPSVGLPIFNKRKPMKTVEKKSRLVFCPPLTKTLKMSTVTQFIPC